MREERLLNLIKLLIRSGRDVEIRGKYPMGEFFKPLYQLDLGLRTDDAEDMRLKEKINEEFPEVVFLDDYSNMCAERCFGSFVIE